MNHIIVSVCLLAAFAATSSYGYNCGIYTCSVGNFCCRKYNYNSKSCYYNEPSGYSCTEIYSSSDYGSSYDSYSYVSLGVRAIAGIASGVIVLIIGGIVACVWCCRRRRNQGRVIGANRQVVTTTTTQQPGTVYPDKQQYPQQGYVQQQNIPMAGVAPPPQQGYPKQSDNPSPPAYAGPMEEKSASYPTDPSATPH